MWGHDPLALGSWAYVPVGAPVLESVKTLREPINNKFFIAGEGTETSHMGTVHGTPTSWSKFKS